MSSGKPWKLYAAHPGQPRLLLESYDTLSEAAFEWCELTGRKSDTVRFIVSVNLDPAVGSTAARFVDESGNVPYVIELTQ